VRKYDDVAQWQNRIDSGFTWRKRWASLCCDHSLKSVLLSLSVPIHLCAATTECRWAGKGIRAGGSDIRARGGMILCFASQSLIRLGKSNDSRRLWKHIGQPPTKVDLLYWLARVQRLRLKRTVFSG
jgi:hypothetical protein